MAVRAAFPYAHITVSPGPAPKRSATTTTLVVGCLSRSYGCTMRKRTPSRSGVFFVDQTVPMTFPKNMSVVSGQWFSVATDSGQLTNDFHALADTSTGSPTSCADGVIIVFGPT